MSTVLTLKAEWIEILVKALKLKAVLRFGSKNLRGKVSRKGYKRTKIYYMSILLKHHDASNKNKKVVIKFKV